MAAEVALTATVLGVVQSRQNEGGGNKWLDGQLQHVTLILMQCGRCGPGGETDDSLITGL